MPVLKFNERDIVKISESDLKNGGQTGEIVNYQGIYRVQMPGQNGKQRGDDSLVGRAPRRL